MRYVPNKLYESFSGKFGQNVNSSNRSGNYIRELVTPYNPQTQRQVAARNAFARCGPLWFGLTASARELFDSWANTGYNPLTPKSATKAYTGRQAYTALAQSVDVGNGFPTTFGVDLKASCTGTVNAAVSATDLALPASPPTAFVPSLELFLKDGANAAVHVPITDWSMSITNHSTGPAVLTLVHTDNLAVTQTNDIKIGLGHIDAGFRVYASEKLAVDGQRYSHAFHRMVFSTKTSAHFTAATTEANIGNLNLSLVPSGDFSDPLPAGWYYLTLVSVDIAGQLKIIDAGYVEIS